MTTYTAKISEVDRTWWIIDAEDLVLGRLAVHAANMLRGKHKPMYSPNIDCGDHIVIINADKIKLTGRKRANKKYYWHTGFPGGIKETTAEKVLVGKFPERVVEKAIKRMIPRGAMGDTQFKKLRVYAGTEHPHEAQKPTVFDVASQNPKNKR